MAEKSYLPLMKEVLRQQAAALLRLGDEAGAPFDAAVTALLRLKGRIAVTGMGKSGHVARKVAATLASTGSPAYFIHPAEASHGDLGMMSKDDAVIAFSNSGDTAELSDILVYATRRSMPVIGVTQNTGSFLARHSDIVLVMPDVPEACPLGCAPTTSTTLMMAVGDALAMALLSARGFRPEDFHQFHPGGRLGGRLALVSEIMHTGEAIPLASADAPMLDVICEMSGKGLGCAGIVENGCLVGIITDGDLRRHMRPGLLECRAAEVMSRSPRTIGADQLAAKALAMMQSLSITSLFIVDEEQRPQGILHIHDCLRAGLS